MSAAGLSRYFYPAVTSFSSVRAVACMCRTQAGTWDSVGHQRRRAPAGLDLPEIAPGQSLCTPLMGFNAVTVGGRLHSGAVGCANASSTALRQLTDRDCFERWTEGPRKEAASCTEHNCHFPLTQPSLQDVWVLVVLCLFFFSCAAPAGTLGRLLGGAPALAPGLSRARTPGGTQGSPERRQIKIQGPRLSTRHTSIGYAYIFV